MFCAVIMAVSLLAGSDDLAGYFDHPSDEYGIEVQVVTEEKADVQVGSGTIVVRDGQSTIVNIALFTDGSYRISSAQAAASTPRSSGRSGTIVFQGELAALVDLSLSPSRAAGGIRIEGTMETMRRVEKSGKPQYEIGTDPIDFVIGEGVINRGTIDAADSHDLLVNVSGRETRLRVRAHRKGQDYFAPADTSGPVRPVTFETEYSLYNEDARRFEEAGKKCSFTCEGRRPIPANSRCMWYDYFPLPDGDSLLYYTEYSVGDIQWFDDDQFSVRVQVMRAYSTNTDSIDTTGEQIKIKFKDAKLTQQNKVIATRVGEVLEIVLEKESDPELPFTPLEKIRLRSSVGR